MELNTRISLLEGVLYELLNCRPASVWNKVPEDFKALVALLLEARIKGSVDKKYLELSAKEVNQTGARQNILKTIAKLYSPQLENVYTYKLLGVLVFQFFSMVDRAPVNPGARFRECFQPYIRDSHLAQTRECVLGQLWHNSDASCREAFRQQVAPK